MRQAGLWSGLLVGALLTAPLIGVMYAAAQLLDLPFVPFDLFDWITRLLPGPLITFGIDTMISLLLALGMDVAVTAKTAEQLMAVLQFVALGAALAGGFFVWLRRRGDRPDRAAGWVVGALWGLPLTAISLAISQSPVNPLLRGLWLLALFLAWGWLVGWVYPRLYLAAPTPADAPAAVHKLNRRQFLVRLGAASATITVLSGGLGAVLAASARRLTEESLEDTMAHQSEGGPLGPFPNSNDPLAPAPGTRPEYTPVKDHYKVFLRAEPSVVPAEGYVLPITGLVDNPVMLTLDDIRHNYPVYNQYVTLSCISGRVGTTLISTTLWTGARLQDILATVRPKPEAQFLHIKSADGFFETVDLSLIASEPRIMLCYAWDGNTLPMDHGFPLRIWIPDRFGMKQPKWITEMLLTDTYIEGYWVTRGWSELAQVQTTSVIDTVAVNAAYESGGQMLIPVGGIAFSGARGISQVEVRVDGGAWQPARLRAPLSETTWVIWRYDWPFTPGPHTFEVRCVDGQGVPQIEESRPARPDGATGIDSFEANG